MTLRKKTLGIIGVTFLALIGILYTMSQTILLESYIRLEDQSARRNVERVLSAFAESLSALDTTTFDWAAWDDAYAFIEDMNEAFIRANLVDAAFDSTGLRINALLFVNRSGKLVYGKGFDIRNRKAVPVPNGLTEHLTEQGLLYHSDTQSSVKGLVLIPQGPMVVVSRPILTSEEGGPIRGAVVMGRFFDAAELRRLAQTTHLSLSMFPADDPDMPPDVRSARSVLSEESPVFIQSLSDRSLAGYVVLKDIYGQSILILRMDMPREIYARGQAAVSYFILSLVAVGVISGLVTLLFLEKTVLARLAGLSISVARIGERRDLSARVEVTGEDELARLGEAINTMLAALEKTEQELIRLERLRALGEMSAGVSHNLNNILVGVVASAQLVLDEAHDPQIRRWIEMIYSAGVQAEGLVRRLHDAVRGEDEKGIDSVQVNRVVRETVQAAQPRWKDESEARGIAIEVQLDLEEGIPPIRGTSSGLYNILLNLLFNAVDAMPEGGTLTVSTAAVEEGVQLKVRDTGIGMEEEISRRIFEPFFTTKMEIGTGLGLSTVYNTVVRWNGRIEVDSTPGEGAEFTLWIPEEVEAKAVTERQIDVPQVRTGKILVVDDQEVIGHMVADLLRGRHEVTSVLSGRQALEAFEGGGLVD